MITPSIPSCIPASANTAILTITSSLAPGKVFTPRFPIVALPALVHSVVVMVRDVDVYEVDARMLAFRREAKDQRRVWVALLERTRSPGMHDQAAGNRLQHPAAQSAAEGAEVRAGSRTDDYFPSGDGAVPLR